MNRRRGRHSARRRSSRSGAGRRHRRGSARRGVPLRPGIGDSMTSPSTTVSKIVTFRLGDDLFAADIYSVERVLRYQQTTPVPNVPDWIDGVIDYQGRVVPLINLRNRFELPSAETVP